jgi:hypothetical protein
MKKSELIHLLAQYEDDQLILVEGPSGGYESPTLYVSAVRHRQANEFNNPGDSEFVTSKPKEPTAGALILGTHLGLLISG